MISADFLVHINRHGSPLSVPATPCWPPGAGTLDPE
jgi:hypothetical protein